MSEVVVRPEDTLDVLKKKVVYATILGTLQSTLTKFKFLSRSWKTNTEQERLLGVSLTGLKDHPVIGRNTPEARMWLAIMKETAIAAARDWSGMLGINMPAAITCVKPSGTVSQLVDCASGMHSRHSPFYIRRVRVSVHDPLCKLLVDEGVPHNPEVGQTMEDASTLVFDFPIQAPESSLMREDETAIEQLEYWKMLQEVWCEHKPSVTISVKDAEWPVVGAWVFNNWQFISGVSFLPFDGGSYQLAPYEAITEEQYKTITSKFPVIDFNRISEFERTDLTDGSREFACVGGKCEV